MHFEVRERDKTYKMDNRLNMKFQLERLHGSFYLNKKTCTNVICLCLHLYKS